MLTKLAAAVGDENLKVAECASAFFAACSSAGAAPLGAVLSDTLAIDLLRELGGGGRDTDSRPGAPRGSVLELRALALFASLAAAGDAQFELVASHGLLEPVLALWRGADPLVRLNAVELLATLASTRSGVDWLSNSGLLAELCVCLETEPGEDALEDLQRPAVLGCLARILDSGGPPAAGKLLGDLGLARRLWPLLKRDVPQEQLWAGLAAMTAAASAPSGMAALLSLEAGGMSAAGEGAGALGRVMAAHDERTRVNAMALVAQLAATYADTASRSTHGPGAMETEEGDSAVAKLTTSLRALIDACSPSPTTSAADAIANMARSFSDELRGAALGLLRALALVEWGALALAGSEGVLELLLTAEQVHTVTADELRLKHSIAQAMMQWQASPQLQALLGSTAAKALNQYVANGPFAVQRARQPQVAAPLTL